MNGYPGDFWRGARVLLRRLARDPISLGLLAWGLFSLYRLCDGLGWALRDGAWRGLLLAVALAAVGGVILLFMRRRQRQQDVVLPPLLASYQPAQSPSTPASVVAYLAERLDIVTALFHRAMAEESQQPGGRERANMFLRDRGLWDRLEPGERELLASPGLSWPSEERRCAAQWAEQIRLLRWTLLWDADIIPLHLFLQPDFRQAQSLPDLPSRKFTAVRPVWDLREQRDLALIFHGHVFGEISRRGSAGQPDVPADSPSNIVVGTSTLGELPEGDLFLLYEMIVSRVQYAAYLSDLLDAPEPFSYSEWAARRREAAAEEDDAVGTGD